MVKQVSNVDNGLVQQAKLGGKSGNAAKEELLKKHCAFICKTAHRYYREGTIIDFEDLIQEGQRGILRAIETFDPSYGVLFLTYAGRWVELYMQKYIYLAAREIQIPQHMLERLAKISKVCQQYEVTHGELPSVQELSKMTELEDHKIEEVMMLPKSDLSLDYVYNVSGDGETTFENFINNPDEDFTQNLELKLVIEPLLDSLPEKEKKVVTMHVFGEMPFREIGDKIGMSHQGAKNVYDRAIHKLRLALCQSLWDKSEPLQDSLAALYK